jgi:hypothetical protein
VKLAVRAAVEKIDNQTEREPNKEAKPGNYRKTGHQTSAEDDRQERKKR